MVIIIETIRAPPFRQGNLYRLRIGNNKNEQDITLIGDLSEIIDQYPASMRLRYNVGIADIIDIPSAFPLVFE